MVFAIAGFVLGAILTAIVMERDCREEYQRGKDEGYMQGRAVRETWERLIEKWWRP